MTPWERGNAAYDAFRTDITYGLLRISERKFAVIRLSGLASNDGGLWVSADFKFVEGFERVSYSAARQKLKDLTLGNLGVSVSTKESKP